MRDPRLHLGSRGIAALLGFLLPGAGHFYQGRNLKGSIFMVCILSTFIGGLLLGQGQPVYSQIVQANGGRFESAQLDSGKLVAERSLGYYVQIFAGIPAMPALIQAWRQGSLDNVATAPDGMVDETFRGDVLATSADGQRSRLRVEGRLMLEPDGPMSASGSFEGTSAQGAPVNLKVSGQAILGRPVFGAPGREVRCNVAPDQGHSGGQLIGTIPRPFLDWFQAPRDNEELDRMHGTLSQKFDVACVFTWIAGLLNIMAIWDAFDGPAYGYGDEDDDENDSSSKG